MTESKVPFERLPKSVVPAHYHITLKPNLKTFIFEGSETVKLKILESTDRLILNALDLVIKSAQYVASDGSSFLPIKTDLSEEQETLVLTFQKPLPCGEGELTIKFTGILNNKMKGFYRSKYTSSDGEVRFCAVTQLCPTSARRMFPCWDEPSLKARFSVTLAVPWDRVALSNMPVKSQGPYPEDADLRLIHFDTTPIMSTYLVAVVVGEFDHVEGQSLDGVKICVYTPVGKKEQGLFALEVASKVLPFYKDYFQIAYPLPKMDLIAIAEFSAGAMENWGLVTYRETCLLVDSKQTSASRKQWVALVIGHELAHQWFGNLVTMEWWTDLWLNEGYATFVEFLCVAHLFPEFQIWTQFVTDTFGRALELDCLRNSHPIEVPVHHPSEIDEIFDDISYNKGASLIRMLHRYIGDTDFRKGMKIYLHRHQYSNTFTEDLWKALEEASQKPVGVVMSSWTKQMGYPVISVKCKQDGDKRVLNVSQKQFFADGSSSGDKKLWMIPLTFCTAKEPDKISCQMVLEGESAEVVLHGVSGQEWVKINPGAVGFHRTKYPLCMLQQFFPAIKDKTLQPIDRMELLDDLFALAQAGKASTVDVLKVMENFIHEDNYTVWNSINNYLGKLNILLSNTPYHDSFKAYGRDLLGNIASRLGWEAKQGESHLQTMLREVILIRLAMMNHPEVMEEAKRRFRNHVSGKVSLPADLRIAVYKAALSAGNEETYKDLIKLYRQTDLNEEKDRIHRSLGASSNEAIMSQVLEFAMSDEVRSQDTVLVITSLAVTPKGCELAWKFFKDNYNEFLTRYQGGFLVGRILKGVTENFVTEDRYLEVKDYFESHPVPGTERTMKQSLETIRLNAAWLSRDSEAIREYLTARKK